MNRQFIEFQGKIILLDDETTSKEAWLIAYNEKEKDIVPLSKMWTCVNSLGCGYDNSKMEKLKSLRKPFTFAAKPSNPQ